MVKVTLAQITLQIFWFSFPVLFYLLFALTFILKTTVVKPEKKYGHNENLSVVENGYSPVEMES